MSALEKPLKINLTWSDVKDTKRMVKLYTGCSTKKNFMFIVDHVRPKHTKLHYFKSTSISNRETISNQSNQTLLSAKARSMRKA